MVSGLSKTRSNRRALWLLLLPVCLIQPLLPLSYGLNPNPRISQYGHTAWRIQDGYFAGSPTAVAQTHDGYLWVGISNGLFRFDGVQFSPFYLPSGQRLSESVVSLLAARDASLWFVGGSDLVHLKEGSLIRYKRDGPQRRANAIIQAKDATIWVTYSRQPFGNALCRVDGLKLRCYGAAEGVTLRYVTAQLQQSLGTRMEERERIARELHDTLLQGVPGLVLRFQGHMKKLPEQEPVRQMMGQVLDHADEVLLEGRQRVRDLRAEGATIGDLHRG
jgi:signal transduction histidine kinase